MPVRCAAHPCPRRRSTTRTPRTGRTGRRSRARAPTGRPRARASARRPWSKTGRSIQRKSGPNPVHQITLATSRTRRPRAAAGRRVRRSRAATRSTPARMRSFRLTRASGSPRLDSCLPGLSADRRPHGQHVREQEPERRREQPIRAGSRRGPAPGPYPYRTATSGDRADDSRAISAPELPAPTTRTPPSWSCDGFRYSLEWNCAMAGSRSAANTGIRGAW